MSRTGVAREGRGDRLGAARFLVPGGLEHIKNTVGVIRQFRVLSGRPEFRKFSRMALFVVVAFEVVSVRRIC